MARDGTAVVDIGAFESEEVRDTTPPDVTAAAEASATPPFGDRRLRSRMWLSERIRRDRDFRAALGAQPAGLIAGMFVRYGSRGCRDRCGWRRPVVAAAGLTRLMSSLLFGVDHTRPLTVYGCFGAADRGRRAGQLSSGAPRHYRQSMSKHLRATVDHTTRRDRPQFARDPSVLHATIVAAASTSSSRGR